ISIAFTQIMCYSKSNAENRSKKQHTLFASAASEASRKRADGMLQDEDVKMLYRQSPQESFAAECAR
ncbi:MAG: hypothetical protein LUC36_07970, partial [Oscillospiraceae bacterium]|nr:hypothetical protein [Oscillospiraceae bacterium]